MKNRTIFLMMQPDVTYVTGGAPTIFIEMCNLFSRHDYTVYGICYSEIQGTPQRLLDNVHFVNLRYHYPETMTYPDTLNRLAKELQPDLFIFFFPEFYTQAKLAEEFDHIPKILMFHSRPDYYFFANKKKIGRDLPSVYRNTVSQILFPSFYHLLPDYIQKNPVVCIPNFSTSSEPIKTDTVRKKIVYLSRLDEFKQQFFLVRAFQIALREIPDWRLDIYGDSNAHYIRLLQDEIDRRGLSRSIRLMGITQNPMETLKEYDFCVFPSSFEGFGIGLVESLSVGLPAIVLKKASACNEIVRDRYNGILTDYSEEAFAKAIVELAKNDEMRIRMSQAACESVRQFDKKNWDARWLSLVEDVLAHRPLPPFPAQPSALPLFSLEEIMEIAKIPARICDVFSPEESREQFERNQQERQRMQKKHKKYRRLFNITLVVAIVLSVLLLSLLLYIWLMK